MVSGGDTLYTFYFQALKLNKFDQRNYKLVAFKGFEVPANMNLGFGYLPQTLDALVSSGYRVVIQPAKAVVDKAPTRMFYAKGYRGPKAKTANSEVAIYALNQEFVNWANGQERDFCNEDFGQDPLNVDSLEREAYIRGDKPSIGPLPPQAPLAASPMSTVGDRWNTGTGIYRYSYKFNPELSPVLLAPMEPLNYTDYWNPPIGTMLNPAEKIEIAEIADNAKEEPSWWQLLKDWVKSDF